MSANGPWVQLLGCFMTDNDDFWWFHTQDTKLEITLRKSAARTKCSTTLYVGDCHYALLCIIFIRVKITQFNHFLILSKLPAQSVTRSIYSQVPSIKNGLKILNKKPTFPAGQFSLFTNYSNRIKYCSAANKYTFIAYWSMVELTAIFWGIYWQWIQNKVKYRKTKLQLSVKCGLAL